MTSKYKALIGNTQQSSSGAGTGALEQPSKQLVNSENTPKSTEITRTQLPSMLSSGKNGLTTLQISEKSRQHAVLMKVALLRLEKAGLAKRYRVLSKDGTTVKEIRVVFDPALWTTTLDLIVLSDKLPNETVVKP